LDKKISKNPGNDKIFFLIYSKRKGEKGKTPVMRKRISLFFILLIGGITLGASDYSIQVSGGLGWFTGDFARHLDHSGAWPWTPVLDSRIMIYPGTHLGVGVQWGSLAAIHPLSEPIEGIIRYNALALEWLFPITQGILGVNAAVGFQDPGMLVSPYGSGFWEGGMLVGTPLKENLYLVLQGFYRSSFLQSIIIQEQYDDWDRRDNMESISLTLGIKVFPE